jgi:hydroxymethylglutaryl-CoA reductase (NADPH)
MSILANFIVFMTFFPASLALILEISPNSKNRFSTWHLTDTFDESEDKKPNPVTQNIKLIMSVGLAAVHLHTWIVSRNTLDVQETSALDKTADYGLWSEFVGIGPDKYIALVLGLVLSMKYIFWDTVDIPIDSDLFIPTKRRQSVSKSQFVQLSEMDDSSMDDRTKKSDLNNSQSGVFEIQESAKIVEEDSGCGLSLPTIPEVVEASSSTKFFIGEVKVDDEEEMEEDSGVGGEFVEVIKEPRSVEECLDIYGSEGGVGRLSDEELVQLVQSKHISVYNLEKDLGDPNRAVTIRRIIIASQLKDPQAIENLPHTNYDYNVVVGACCENVIGYIPIPVGIVGPLLLDNQEYRVPMATTEGTLVASTNRGCSALRRAGGVWSILLDDGMTRGPVVRFPSASMASDVKRWLECPENFVQIQQEFNQESRHTALKSLKTVVAGRHLFIRFKANTGDAMGMNMVSKGSENALKALQGVFPDMEIVSVSGNFCTDKKPSAVNWIEGRGKSVVSEAVISSAIVKQTLKTSVQALVDVNTSKNLIGSAMSGSIGGFNAHAANIVTAIYLATGQDPAQNVCSSNCITLLEAWGPNKEDLYVSCTMPSVEVGTVGGGTNLLGQSACLQMLGVKGPNRTKPGNNAATLARIVCATVLAGELSLLSALAEGHLVRSHMKHNRSSANLQ